ncbi:bifunctional (p)ppGpp synthetase/guanosine-3',5'-bis(diphosphate) 3'-pyrophosphohydrolase [Cryomorpha ignava]|uniref:Bifunctional (P)ppGpp synthetase/guanosine-3',5'-bis(Diphosphate) 3'-pyrophosphohydrolase n=1 Tax=Cryomorpha ignava TaxID=101383 RepID=A0A7K3WTY3_9FLAO|nr:bifunctional (p)ppGpp synthetase/guanosine-3',5'-bis(diphosphate) 3'-pyrophosphohydrolase [Cryomorpha ignava]NEN24342.1 bifunctional (p)ppGpp synthetase/guanosine-3',5'-bis(diphosphate) 3'-pyrophosphohydrolase [Cryomorpha ignava]
MDLEIDLEQEKKEILSRYRGLLRVIKNAKSPQDKRDIRKAFDVALEAHKDMRRKTGEPYIYHPIAVARIVAEEIGLGPTAIVAALLHDTVEDTDISLADIDHLFGPKVKSIIDGLTKIADVFDHTASIQAENFKKMLLTLSDDVRVILIKLADRLHNMRTLESMRRDKQLKIASETLFMYAPLAHRLGLYSIKTELEDLSLKYTEPEEYADIAVKLKKGQAVRTRFINRFTLPIRRKLDETGFKYEIKSRTKSIYSIWNKIHKKDIPFEEIYDLFAIRIILDTKPENEKAESWKVYSIVTDFYQPNPDRLRDWISTPKTNGYESLHTTVMSPTGKWVEIQIRTQRMDEVAEMGYAAHWKYKGKQDGDSSLDQWLARIRDMLESASSGAIDFIDDFKLNLFSDEIFVFTPDGELKSLPKGATALDFAFEIHSQVGESCIGAKVNQRLVPLSHQLKSGDQIEILTSKKQKAKEDWLSYVVTGKAKSKIKTALKEEQKKVASIGKEMVQRKFKSMGAEFNSKNVAELEQYFKYKNTLDLYQDIASGKISLKKIKSQVVENGELSFTNKKPVVAEPESKSTKSTSKIPGDTLFIGDDEKDVPYKIAPCCNPIPGDDVFGFVTINDGIKIHRMNCPNAVQLRSNYAYRVIKAKWQSQKDKEFLANVLFKGIDDVGLVSNITQAISTDLNVNMKSISFESNDGVFDGRISVYVYDKDHLNNLMRRLRNVEGVLTVERGELYGEKDKGM